MAPRPFNISPEDALYVVNTLIDEKRLTGQEVLTMLRQRERKISELEAYIARLRGDQVRSSGRRPSTGNFSAETVRSRKIQGEYMGLLRHLTGKERDRIRKIAAERGREAAIREMRRKRR